MDVKTVIMFANHTSSEWETIDTIIPKGCPCIEFTGAESKLKLGDGEHSFRDLPYATKSVAPSDTAGHLTIDGLDVEIFKLDDTVSADSDLPVRSNAVQAYVDSQIKEVKSEIKDTIENGISFELVD